MAGHETHPHSLFEVPPIEKPAEIDFGKTYDGRDLNNTDRYGFYYSKNEIVLLGSGDEDLGLEMIGDGLLAEFSPEEGQEEVYRPYDAEIEELVRSLKLH